MPGRRKSAGIKASKQQNVDTKLLELPKVIKATDDQISSSIRKIYVKPTELILWNRWDVWFWVKYVLQMKFTADKFWNNEIVGMSLGSISDTNLKDMEINSVGRRKKILLEVRKRQEQDKARNDITLLNKSVSRNSLTSSGSSTSSTSSSRSISPRPITSIRIKVAQNQETLPEGTRQQITETVRIIRISGKNLYASLLIEITKIDRNAEMYYKDKDGDWIKLNDQQDLNDVIYEFRNSHIKIYLSKPKQTETN